jgi:hypothetical protein
MLRKIKRKLYKVWSLYGPVGAVIQIATYPYTIIRDLAIARRRNTVQAEFDREFNVDTAGLISLSSLDVDSPNWEHGINYGPTSPASFAAVMDAISALSIDLSDFTFIDFGSGKGAVLLYAAAFPFKDIIGVEFSSHLHQIAQSNIARHPLASRRRVRSILCDASQYEIPDGPLLTFFNRPFTNPLMDSVLSNIRASLRYSPRLAYVCTIRVDDNLRDLSSGDFLSVVGEGVSEDKVNYRIYVSGIVSGT